MNCFIVGSYIRTDNCDSMESFYEICMEIGKTLAISHYSLSICSPFKDSADYWVLQGYLNSSLNHNQKVKIHYVDTEEVKNAVFDIGHSDKLIRIPCSPIDPVSNNYSWLLCQLRALESCNVVLAIGGKIDGVASMLLLLADAKNKPILPLPFMEGTAMQLFNKKKFELQDKLGDDVFLLEDSKKVIASVNLLEKLYSNSVSINNKQGKQINNFFISYPRERPNEADYIETLLRRRNFEIFRDESDFGASHDLPTQIREAIFKADVFIATWCKEYACSPWCFDELELALERLDKGKLIVWIFNLDNTRIVPKKARNRVIFDVSSRIEIEGRLLGLLDK